MHTIVRVSEKVRGERSAEERLRFVEDELARMSGMLVELGRTLGKLVENSTKRSQSEPLKKDDR